MNLTSRTALAVLTLLAAGGTSAAEVDVYGVIDLGLHYVNSDSAPASGAMDSGISKGSRIGMRGKEPLGNGWSAIFTLESGFLADSGEFDNTKNRLFNRGASVGLSAPWGKIEMGRLGALGSGVTGSIFLNGYTTFGNLYREAQALQVINHQAMRLDNAVRFESAAMGGMRLYAEYSNGVDGEDSGFDSRHDRFAAVGATYSRGPLSLVFVADNCFRNGSDNARFGRDDSQTYNFGLKYRTDDLTLTAAWQIGRGVEKLGNQMSKPGSKDSAARKTYYDNDGFDSNAFVLGLKSRLLGGQARLQAGYAWGTAGSVKTVLRNDGTVKNGYPESTRVKAHVWQAAAGYDYPLGKSTYLYASAAYVDRSYRENGVETKGAGKTDTVRSLTFGICTSF